MKTQTLIALIGVGFLLFIFIWTLIIIAYALVLNRANKPDLTER